MKFSNLLLSTLATLVAALPTDEAAAAATAATSISNTGVEGIVTTTLHPVPTPTVTPDTADDADAAVRRLTITVVNKHGQAITTSHAHNSGSPTAVSGAVGHGTMAAAATAAFVVPVGWGGNVAVNDASFALTGADSLIEASFTGGVADVDVSYVAGFSLPIVCRCAGQGWLTGCNKDLWSLNTCGNPNGQHACVNPRAGDEGATSAAPFFAPCEHAAWTYPNDSAANGGCAGEQITCCVGAKCHASKKQS